MEEPAPEMPAAPVEVPAEAPVEANPPADGATERKGESGNDEAPGKHPATLKQTVASSFQEIVTFLTSPRGERFIVLEIFVITAMTLLLYLLYQKELKSKTDFKMAMEMIRSTVVGTDSKYKDKDDLLILAAAENLTREIQYLTSRNDQLQKEIDIISRNVKDGWVYFKNAYYWLSDGEGSWMNSQQACQREDATLLSIETEEEQIFVADLVYAKKKPFWLGLFKDKQGKWKWLSGTMVGADGYWRRKEPNPAKKHDCGAMYFSCPQTKCWVAYICEHRKGCICKKVPKDVWLN